MSFAHLRVELLCCWRVSWTLNRSYILTFYCTVCKYFLPFNLLLFHFGDSFLCGLEPSQLDVISFVYFCFACAGGILLRSLAMPMSFRVFSVFFFTSCVVESHRSRFLIHLKFFIKGISYFCSHRSSFLSTSCWRVCPFFLDWFSKISY